MENGVQDEEVSFPPTYDNVNEQLMSDDEEETYEPVHDQRSVTSQEQRSVTTQEEDGSDHNTINHSDNQYELVPNNVMPDHVDSAVFPETTTSTQESVTDVQEESVHDDKSWTNDNEDDIHNDIDDTTNSNDHNNVNTHSYNLRSKTKPNHQRLHNIGETQLHQMERKWMQDLNKVATTKRKPRVNIQTNDVFRKTVGVMMAQLSKEDKYAQVSVSEGIKRHGVKAIEAVLSEYTQLNDRNIFRPMHHTQLTKK